MGNRNSMMKVAPAAGYAEDSRRVKESVFLEDATEQRHAKSSPLDLDKERLIQQLLQDRERISRDLHDGVLQSLYAVGLTLSTCRILVDKAPTQVAGRLDQAVAQLDEAVRQVRALLGKDLGAQSLAEEQLEQALRSLVQTISIGSSVEYQLDIDSEVAARVPREQHAQLLNIAREALSNSLRHARPKTVGVTLQAGQEGLHLEVWDDGIGFNPRNPPHRGFGLDNLARRTAILGGRVQIVSKPWHGTRVVLQLPWK